MARNPRVSVVIPTYNHSHYVRGAIDSVLSQTYKDFEIIVVDDGSSDNTKDVLKDYGSGISYIYQANKGLSSARNTGIKASGGEYIQLLDADDRILPGKLAFQVELLDDCPRTTAGVACGYTLLSENGEALSVWARYDKDDLLFEDLLLGNPFAVNALLLRRNCLNTTGLFDEKLRACEDWDMWLRLARRRYKFRCHDDVLAQCIRPSASMRDDASNMCKHRLAVLDKAYAGHTVDSTAEPLKTRAYHNAYLKCSWGYYSNGETKEGRRCFIEAIRLCPSELGDPGTFYKFHGLFKRFGADRVPASLEDRRKIEEELFRLLSEVFSRGKFSSGSKAERRKAYAAAYLGLSLRCYELQDISTSRRHSINALRTWPMLVSKLPHVFYCLKPFLGFRLVAAINRWKNMI